MKVSEMTDEQIADFIAVEVMGWVKSTDDFPETYDNAQEGWVESAVALFNPATSYDDMHRAEMALPEESWEQYLYELQIIATGGNLRNIPRRTPRLFAAVTATPRQRAEAIARCLGGGE